MEVDDSTEVDHCEDPGDLRCEMVVCIESGPAFELKWCPLPANDLAEVGSIVSWCADNRGLH